MATTHAGNERRSGVSSNDQNGTTTTAERRKPHRKSNSLGGEPRGDTGAAALATLDTSSVESSSTRTSSEKLPRQSKRRKAKGLYRRWLRFSLRHTWMNPLIIVLTILLAYAVNPTTSNPFRSAIFLSYRLPETASSGNPVHYGKGSADFAFVSFYIVVFTFTREFLMQRMIRPLAIRWGVLTRAKQARFMEQFYTAVYFGVFGPLGMNVMSRTPVWYFNTTAFWQDYPHRTHEGIFKAYYLLQAAYWAQQAIVLILMLEKPRKDFKELVLHHIITLALIWLSYSFHFTHIGIAVYITHDISDFFLASSKVLNYLDSPITGPYFFIFMLVWTYMRHYINLRILWSVLTTFSTVGPFELDWRGGQFKCRISQVITFVLLATLQAVNLFWLFLIFRIAYRFVTTKEVADERSEDEDDEVVDEDEEEDDDHQKHESIDHGAVVAEVNGLGRRRSTRLLNGHGGDGNGSVKGETPQVMLNGTPVGEAELEKETSTASASRRGRKGK